MSKSGKRKKDKGHKGGKPAKKSREEDKPAKSSEPPDPPPEPLGSPDSQPGEEELHRRVFKMKPKYFMHNLLDGYSKSAGSSLYGARLISTMQGQYAQGQEWRGDHRIKGASGGRCRVKLGGHGVRLYAAGSCHAV